MNKHRFKDVSIVPQYAMSALTPTRKVGKIIAGAAASRGVCASRRCGRSSSAA